MSTKPEYLVDLIFNKFKNYKARKIFLEKENLKKFIFSLFKENWIKGDLAYLILCIKKVVNVMYSFSSLTIFLIISFILSLYFLYKVTSNQNN